MSSRAISSEVQRSTAKLLRSIYGNHGRATTSTEKDTQTRIAKSYKTMATYQDWIYNERVKAANCAA